MPGNAAGRPTSPADVIWAGGPVYTPDPARRTMVRAVTADGPASAVAVTAGRITAVGTSESLAQLAGPRTEVIGLRGRPLLPAFQDAHVHPCFAGWAMMRCDLAGARDAAEALARIRDYARGPSRC